MALWPRLPAAACAAAELTVRHAHALAKLGAGDEGLIAQALITVARLRRDLKAEHHDGPSPVRDPGNDSDQPRREMSTAADCGTLAASDHATTAAIRPAPLRGSPRIATTMIPFSIFNAAADAVVSVPGRYQPNLIPGRVFSSLRRLGNGRTRAEMHPVQAPALAGHAVPHARSAWVRWQRAWGGAAQTHADASERR